MSFLKGGLALIEKALIMFYKNRYRIFIKCFLYLDSVLKEEHS